MQGFLDGHFRLASSGGKLKVSGLGFEHLSIRCLEIALGGGAEWRGHFGWIVLAAQIDRFPEAFGEFDAGRATFEMALDLLAGVGRQLEIEVLREQREDLLTAI